MAAAGFTVYFLDGYRSTPELSFAVRYKQCSCGIMVTASHNPPSDNAVKVYWSTGGQLLPPHDQGVIDRVMSTTTIHRVPFAEALAAGKIVFCQEEVDPAFIAAVQAQGFPGPRDLKIIYSPLHGVGASAVLPALAADGFADVEVFGPHATPDGDFPNVPGHVSNPENPPSSTRSSTGPAESRRRFDPGHRSRLRSHRAGGAAHDQAGRQWATLTGNQIGALLGRLPARSLANGRPPHARSTTSSRRWSRRELIRRIADAYGVRRLGNLQVGFKWIGGTMDEIGPGQVRLRRRGVARLPGRARTPATRTRPWPRCCWPSWPPSEGRRANAARKARCAVLAVRLSRRNADLGCHARSRGHGADDGADDQVPPAIRRANWPA